MGKAISVDISAGIATVTISRPEVHNAINYQGWLSLRSILEKTGDDDEVEVIVLTSAGAKAFSTGADIKDFSKYRHDSTQAKVYAEAFNGAVDALASITKPTICSIKGYCIGGGCELSLAADLRIAANNSLFGIPAARLGIVIGYQEMQRLVHLVGPGHANYILLSGRIFQASEAEHMGLVNSVVPLDEIDATTHKLAKEISHLAPLSHTNNKKILQRVLVDPNLSTLTAEDEHLPFTNFDSEDYVEGRRAFSERRPPVFRGL